MNEIIENIDLNILAISWHCQDNQGFIYEILVENRSNSTHFNSIEQFSLKLRLISARHWVLE